MHMEESRLCHPSCGMTAVRGGGAGWGDEVCVRGWRGLCNPLEIFTLEPPNDASQG